MPLAQTPTSIVTDPRSFLTVIYGEPGVGKTSLGTQIEGHYFLCAEQGISGVQVIGDLVPTWQDFLMKCQELKVAKESGWADQREVKVIIVDTYDALWDACAAHVMTNEKFIVKGSLQKFERVDDVEYGKAFKRVNETIISVLRKLRLLGFGIILLAHAKDKNVNWRGQDLKRVTLALSDSGIDALSEECDAIGYLMVEERTEKNDKGEVVGVECGRWCYWQPTFLRLAKHRLQDFPERTPVPKGCGWEEYTKAFQETIARLNKEQP